MREKPDVVRESSSEASEEEVKRKRIDLSVAQVAGSAVAAVLAAVLASSFGVYGTIAGAGVVSVIATCGGSLFQHLFTRTGEQLRPGRTPVGVTMAAAPQAPPAPGEFTEGTVYRARVRGWKRLASAAAVVFGIAMTGITVYELASGESLSGRGGTTVGDALTRQGTSSADSDSDSGSDPGGSGSGDSDDAGETGGPGAGTSSASPSRTPGGQGDDGTPSGGDGGTAGSPTPAPTASGETGGGENGGSGGGERAPPPRPPPHPIPRAPAYPREATSAACSRAPAATSASAWRHIAYAASVRTSDAPQ